MPVLEVAEQEQIKVLLGYASAPNLLYNQLREDEEQGTIDAIRKVLTELLSEDVNTPGIDKQLRDARSDSMAMGVGNLKLSYAQHVGHLKIEGSRYLRELSDLLGVEILFDKYRNKKHKKSYW